MAPAGERGGQIPSVTVIVPGRSEVARTVTASGALAARRDQPVGVAGEGGLVRAVLVDAGSWVRQGQVLASIDRSVQSQTAAQLGASIQVARADAALAQNEYDRSAALVGRGFVSKADLDRKRAARDAAQARVRVAQAQLGATRAQIGRLDIRAPTSGLVLARSIEVGQIVGPAPAPCSASPGAAKWKCAPKCRSRTWRWSAPACRPASLRSAATKASPARSGRYRR